ncbi:hypothetical protein BAY61_21995 [Prauserella marina]|uniref:Uncharacterized protein n=1 Tax=Prauserella marina TaxID=530584 RepID=A0A222VTH2_9PSEU|nr:hypothetical protein [Prauserella marina]ASR37226.1 hypothetical protein BAY61_21995 [Prauserella marina]PWV72546.1 hypothetical protein DES30_110145 [Prauserella marina]SDD77506.1 hypothetical protein SAMN05421630_11293 [Prauserella marina]
MTEHGLTISVPASWLWLFRLAGGALGFGLAFVVGPVVDWLLSLAGGAPGPLRLAAELPPVWAIPVLTLAGLGLGFWFARQWRDEAGRIEVSAEGITVHRGGTSRHVDRATINAVFTDGKDLVLLDARSGELLRAPVDDVLVSGLRAACDQLGHPWKGTTDPREDAFVTWIDGSATLDTHAHELFRARQRALADKLPGAAEKARDELRDLGFAVRDRKNGQQYRIVTSTA